MSYLDRLDSAQVSFDEYGAPAFLPPQVVDLLDGFGWGSVDCVGCSGFRLESFQSALTISVTPVEECSSRDLCVGADFVDWHPLPTFSDAPQSESHNVSWFLHVGTPDSLIS